MRRIFRVCSQKHTFADFSSPCSFAPDAIKRNCSLFSFPRVQIPTFSRETTMLPSGGGIGFTEVTQLKMRMCTLGKRCARSCFVPPAPWRPKKSRRALQILAAVVSLKDGLHQVDFLRCWPRVCRLHFGAFYPRKKAPTLQRIVHLWSHLRVVGERPLMGKQDTFSFKVNPLRGGHLKKWAFCGMCCRCSFWGLSVAR